MLQNDDQVTHARLEPALHEVLRIKVSQARQKLDRGTLHRGISMRLVRHHALARFLELRTHKVPSISEQLADHQQGTVDRASLEDRHRHRESRRWSDAGKNSNAKNRCGTDTRTEI